MSAHTVSSRIRRFAYLNRAFLRIGVLDALSYPLSFVARRLLVVVPVVIFAIISDFLAPGGRGDEYFSYVVVGIVISELLDAGARGLGDQLGQEINTGRLEMYLSEPVPTAFLPFGLVQFDIAVRTFTAAMVAVLSLFLGATFTIGWNVITATGTVLLGLLATMAVAVAGSAVKILAKRADPLLTVYSMGARIFGGVFFPVDQLPGWLEPLAYLFPHTYVIAVTRRLLLPESPIDGGATSTPTAIVALVGMIAVLMPIGMWAFLRAVEYGKRRGLLAGY